MADTSPQPSPHAHHHVFLAQDHDASERRTWAVIWLCGAMMAAEIVGGLMFGSIALVADGLHMSTHAGALLLAALAYNYSRCYAHDPRFSFGTGKIGDLAGFTSAIVLAMISLLIAYESVTRLLNPVNIQFGEAIPIAVLGLGVNLFSAWLLSRGGHHHHHHGHGHGHAHGDHDDHDHEEAHVIATGSGPVSLSVFEDGVPPRFRLQWAGGCPDPSTVTVETERPDGERQAFGFANRGAFLESVDEIPEPHAFVARLRLAGEPDHAVAFEEHDHGDAAHDRDNNMRAAIVHVMADAAVSVLVIIGLVLAWKFGWLWMDPIAGMVGSLVIASWSYGLIRDTGSILLDMTPDASLAARMRQTVEANGGEVTDLHLWRLGPGHLGAIVCIATRLGHDAAFYRRQLAKFRPLSHLSVEVIRA